MRQLVSVIADGSVRYFVHDGDRVRQIAEIVDPGADVTTVIEIGVSLAALYESRNGDKPKPKPAPAAASPPARPAGKRPMRRWGASQDAVLADLRAHPGSSVAEIATRVTGSDEHGARQTVNATLGVLRKQHEIISEPAMIIDLGGQPRTGVRLTLVEHG